MSKQEQQRATHDLERNDGVEVKRGVKFRDKAFKSRVIVFPGQVTAHVERCEVTVIDPAQIDALSKRDDFERVSE